MSYRVLWEPYAEERLFELLENSADGSILAKAAKLIDRALAVDPVGFGESRHGTVWIGFVMPPAVLYDVQSDMQTIIVYDVWRVDRRSTS